MKSDGEWRERKKARDSGSMLHAAMMLPSSAACSHAANNRQLPSVTACSAAAERTVSKRQNGDSYNIALARRRQSYCLLFCHIK